MWFHQYELLSFIHTDLAGEDTLKATRDVIRTKKRHCWARFRANILLHARTCLLFLARAFTRRILAEHTLKNTYTQTASTSIFHYSFNTITKEITLQCTCSWLNNASKRTYLIFSAITLGSLLFILLLSSPSVQYSNFLMSQTALQTTIGLHGKRFNQLRVNRFKVL